MVPVLTLLVQPSRLPLKLREAALIVVNAARSLAGESPEAAQVSRYREKANLISVVLDTPESTRQDVLEVSPAVIEMTGNTRTLVEMIEAETSDDAYRLRLAKLLFRAIVWQQGTF